MEMGLTANSDILKGLQSQKCEVSHNNIGLRDLQAMSHALAINAVVQELDLSDNNIDGEVTFQPPQMLRGELIYRVSVHCSEESKV